MIDNIETRPPLLFILSGPAGSGKTTLCDRMLETFPESISRVITTTSRSSRGEEKEGIDYYFLSNKEFFKKIDNNEFLEHAEVHHKFYGCYRKEVIDKFAQGKDLLLNIDIQGAETYRKLSQTEPILMDRVVTIFIMPPSIDELKERLEGRNQDHREEIENRLKIALGEVQAYSKFDYCIPSSNRDDDFACLMSIYAAEKLKVKL